MARITTPFGFHSTAAEVAAGLAPSLDPENAGRLWELSLKLIA